MFFRSMDLRAVRRQLPVTRQWIYLNHAAVAPLSRPAAEGMCRLVRDAEEIDQALQVLPPVQGPETRNDANVNED